MYYDKPFYLAIISTAFFSCASTVVIIPPPEPIKILEGVSEIRSGTVLFVNESVHIWQKCLVFRDYYNLRRLLSFDNDGMPTLQIAPIGHFEVGPAKLDSLIQRAIPEEELVGFFISGLPYTVLVVAENSYGRVMDIRTIIVKVPDVPLQNKYHYYSDLLRRPTERFVNHLVYLPSAHLRHVEHQFNFSDLIRNQHQ